MRILYSPTVNDDFRYEYTFNKETIKAELYEISMIDEVIDETIDEVIDETVDDTLVDTIDEIVDEGIDEVIDETVDEIVDETIVETLVDTKIYDLSNVEAGKEYTSLPEFIVEINRTEDNNLEVEVVSYVSSSETDDKALFPEWVEVEEHEFDAQDSKVLEEMPVPKHRVNTEKELLQAQVDILVEEAEFKDDLLQQLILEVYSTK